MSRYDSHKKYVRELLDKNLTKSSELSTAFATVGNRIKHEFDHEEIQYGIKETYNWTSSVPKIDTEPITPQKNTAIGS